MSTPRRPRRRACKARRELDGKSTRFLPFNLGHNLGKGNPPNPGGHKTSYLWERVWTKDAWLDILHRFIHVDRPAKGSVTARRAAEKIIFPRYHQWDAVMKLQADAIANGTGQSYLIQHSAGSGKSNTIAWAAHRLSTLHTAEDRKIFDKVVVITDRVILDRQLPDSNGQQQAAARQPALDPGGTDRIRNRSPLVDLSGQAFPCHRAKPGSRRKLPPGRGTASSRGLHRGSSAVATAPCPSCGRTYVRPLS